MALVTTYRRQLHDVALDQYGYVTTLDARDLGIPTVELRKMASRGGLDRVGRGVYRFENIPRQQQDQYMEAVLLVGRDAYLTHDAVLALHDLGLVNPRRIRVGTPHRIRAKLPTHIEVRHRKLGPEDVTTVEGIPTTTVRRALLDCRGLIMDERLIEAAEEAARRGLLRRRGNQTTDPSAAQTRTMKPMAFTRIKMDHRIMGGLPCIAGTRIPAAMLVRMIAAGWSEEAILSDYPQLEAEDIHEALRFAAANIDQRVVPLQSA